MIEEVILAIGRPDFSQALFSRLLRDAQVRQLLIYRYTRDGEAEALASEGLEGNLQDRLSQHHGLDPMRRQFAPVGERVMSVEVLAQDEISDDAFRRYWALHHKDRQRISIVVRQAGQVQVIDMFVPGQDDASVERLRNYIASNARAISSATERHFELARPTRAGSLMDAAERLMGVPCDPPLSTREALVCAYIVSGHSNEATALGIGISVHSVVTYRKRSYAKLRISSQQELFSLFFSGGARADAPPAPALLATRMAPVLGAASAGLFGRGERAAMGAIRQLQHSYCRVLQGLDLPFGSAVWHDDGLAIYDNYFEGTGREFWRWMATSYPSRSELLHDLGETTINVQKDAAFSETPVTLVRLRRHPERPQLFTARGRYLDEWTRQNGKWGLAKRRYVRDVGYIRDLQPSEDGDGSPVMADHGVAALSTETCSEPSGREFLAGARSISGARRRALGR